MNIQTTRRQVLRQLIKDLAHGNREEFGKRYDINADYLSQIVDKRPISEKSAQELEEKIGLPSGYFGNTEHILKTPIDLLALGKGAPEKGSIRAESYVDLPVLEECPASRSTGQQAPVALTKERVRFPARLLAEAKVDKEQAAIAIVTSSAMEPMIGDGASIGIDMADAATRNIAALVDGKVYAVDHAGQLRVRYLFRGPAGSLRMHSLNATHHPDEIYAYPQVASEIRILGRVFWVSMLL